MNHDERVAKLTAINAGVDRLVTERDAARSEGEEAMTAIDQHIDELHAKVAAASPEAVDTEAPQA